MPKNVIPTLAPLEPEIDNAAKLGQLIRAKRTALGIRMSDCASLCGVGINTLSRLENGNPNTTLNSVFSVLNGLGITLNFEVEMNDLTDKDEWA